MSNHLDYFVSGFSCGVISTVTLAILALLILSQRTGIRRMKDTPQGPPPRSPSPHIPKPPRGPACTVTHRSIKTNVTCDKCGGKGHVVTEEHLWTGGG